jgi:cation diffusion facilitator CzcD-associated flavoprotein CzcO
MTEITASQADTSTEYDAIVVGAGIAGIYLMYRMQALGLKALLLERACDVGGTWHWNRYPGARFDSESYSYCYSFSKELLAEWNWSERFAGQPEIEKYLQFVVEKFDLRKDMLFNKSVTSAQYDGAKNAWKVDVADETSYEARFLVTALGLLSAPTKPRYAEMESFKGTSFHTYFAPKEPIDYKNKRVAVIGTGATGVQVICAIVDQVSQLTVFQRRPNWCAPLNNSPIAKEEMEAVKGSYDKIFNTCNNTPSGFIHNALDVNTFDVADDERKALWEKLYSSPGFGLWLANYKDTVYDERANAALSEFVAEKIRQRVQKPEIADKLIPKDHGFGTRRIPMEKGYYEAFNRDNVRLVDLFDTPIERITPTGIRTTAEDFEFDIIIYATGFDAITGPFDRLNITGVDGKKLSDAWSDGPKTVLGVMVPGFPNLITVAGPQSGSVATNFPRGIEPAVEWCTEFLSFMKANGITRVEPKTESAQHWEEEVRYQATRILFAKQKSWFTGYNSNIDREFTPRYLMYVGGQPRYRNWLKEEKESNYSSFELA